MKKWNLHCKSLGVFICLTGALLLTGCEGSNPLLSGENLTKLKSAMQDRYFTQNEASVCAEYYSAPSAKPTLQTACEKWSAKTYDQLQNGGDLPTDATLAEFRDPALWALIKHHKA